MTLNFLCLFSRFFFSPKRLPRRHILVVATLRDVGESQIRTYVKSIEFIQEMLVFEGHSCPAHSLIVRGTYHGCT